jgi:hypothetical protein
MLPEPHVESGNGDIKTEDWFSYSTGSQIRGILSLDFGPTLRALDSARDVVGRSGNRFSRLNGLSTINNLWVIRQLFLKSKPLKTLEVGIVC